MTDTVDAETRSRMMASIRRVNTAPELVVRSYLHAAGLRFRLHDSHLPGRPDIVLARHRVALFVHGCFWHRHQGCRFATVPVSNAGFWSLKFAQNVQRDRESTAALERTGWTVLVIWECEVRDVGKLDALYWRIRAATPEDCGLFVV